eukprot:5645617-Amphidinium_carterae.2
MSILTAFAAGQIPRSSKATLFAVLLLAYSNFHKTHVSAINAEFDLRWFSLGRQSFVQSTPRLSGRPYVGHGLRAPNPNPHSGGCARRHIKEQPYLHRCRGSYS